MEMSGPWQMRAERFSAVLYALARSLPADGLALQKILDQLGEGGFLMLSMVATIPFLLPVSIPGSSIPFGLVIALNGAGVLAQRTPWLPRRLLQYQLTATQLQPVLIKGARLFSRLERLMHPRLLFLTQSSVSRRFNGGLLLLSGLLLMAPLPLPFSNTLPAYAALCLAAGSLERDGYLVLAGYTMLGLTIAYFGAIVLAGRLGLRALLGYL
jgi:hypothetical protein